MVEKDPQVKKAIIDGNGTLPCPFCKEPTVLATGSICTELEVDDEPYVSGVVSKTKSGKEEVHVHFAGVSVHFCEQCNRIVYLDIDGFVHMQRYEKGSGDECGEDDGSVCQGAPKPEQVYAVFETNEDGRETRGLTMVTKDQFKAKRLWQGGYATREDRMGFIFGDRVYLLDRSYPGPLVLDENIPLALEEKRKAALSKLTDEEKAVLGIKV